MSFELWKKTTLGDVCQIICGATPSTIVPEYWSNEIKWATAKDVSESTGYKLYDTERKISKLGY
jgi:type I restriction enzyme S subunit